MADEELVMWALVLLQIAAIALLLRYARGERVDY
jgi:hypothetical protein